MTFAIGGRNADGEHVLKRNLDGDGNDEILPHPKHVASLPVVEVAQPAAVDGGVDVQAGADNPHQRYHADL